MNASGGLAAITDLLLDHVPAAFAMFDTQMRYLACSKRWRSEHGLEDEDLIGRSHYELFPETSERSRDIHRRALLGETLSCEEDPVPRKDCGLDWIQWEILPWRTEAGEIGGVVVFTQVMTAIRTQRIHAARANAMGTMASTLAHELNQPIMAIKNYVEGVRGLLNAPDPEVSEALQLASSEATRAGDIVRRLRAFVSNARAETRIHSLSVLIGGALELASADLHHDGATATFSVDPDGDAVLGDCIQIEQVLVNILHKTRIALKDCETRAITISGRPESDRLVRITFAGTGNNLCPDAMANTFDTLVRTDGAEMDPGLSICRTIIEANGGRIWLEQASDTGGLVHLTLPRAPAQA